MQRSSVWFGILVFTAIGAMVWLTRGGTDEQLTAPRNRGSIATLRRAQGQVQVNR